MAQQRKKRTLYQRLVAWTLTSALVAGMLAVVSTPASAAMGQYESRDGIMRLQEDAFFISENTASGVVKPVSQTTITEPNIIDIGGSVTGDRTSIYAFRRDTVTITSKYAIDWSQSFELKTYFENDGLPDGMTISFHNDPNYDGSGRANGDLGVYSNTDGYGVKNAAIFEVDTFNNNDYTGYGQGDRSDAAFKGKGNDACHLGFSLTNDLGRLTKAYVGNKNSKLARNGLNIVTIKWDAVQGQATLSFEDTAGAGVNETLLIGSDKFDPETLWGDKPVYMTISAAIHQNNNHGSSWGSYYLKVDNFVYTDLSPKESAQYLVYRGGDMTSTPVTYKSDDMMTWPMPGDTVVAEHTMWNSTNDVDKPISIPIRVPEARISDSSNGYSVVQELTPTDLNGTTGETNIFNGAKSGSALSTATFTFPQTDQPERNATARYTYTIPQGIKGNYVLEDKVTIGSPIMTQYTYYNTINLGGLPTASAPDLQLPKGYGGGSFDLTSDLIYANYSGTQDNTTFKITNAEGEDVSTIDTSKLGTYKITYTVTDSRFHNAVTSFVRTITVTDGGSGGGTGGGTTTEYTLTYESNGGTAFTAEKHASGTEVKLTKIPRRDGYIFTGWYSDDKLSQRVTSVTIQKNTTVYAGWAKAESSHLLNTKDHTAYFFGYDDGLMHPTDNITRGQTAMVLFRLLNEEHKATILTSENSFPDVDSSNWYNEAVSTLANGGYINGYPDGTFCGDNTITRMEFVAMLVRVLGVDETAECNYSDVSRDDWAYRYIATASKVGWVNGMGDGTFRPEQPITRAESIAIFNRILNRGVDENSSINGHKTWPDNQPGTWYYYEVIEATTSHEYTGSRPSENWTHVSQD